MDAIAEKPEYQEAVAVGNANDWTQLYGEAAVFKAYAYHTLIGYFGDVPHFKETIKHIEKTEGATITSRDEISDFQLAELQRVEPLMYRLGEGHINADRFSRTFAQGLIGRSEELRGGHRGG